jgi:hypothetical protein
MHAISVLELILSQLPHRAACFTGSVCFICRESGAVRSNSVQFRRVLYVREIIFPILVRTAAFARLQFDAAQLHAPNLAGNGLG